MDWFILSLIGMILYGVQNFIYKIVAEKRLNSGLVLLTSFITGAVLSGIFLCFTFTPQDNYAMIFAFAVLQASFYLISRYVKIESFKYIPVVVALPISRIHFALTALLAIIILNEPYTPYTILGILLFMGVIFILSKDSHVRDIKKSNFRSGIALAIATAIFTTISEFMVKIAAVEYDVLIFMFLSYLWLAIPSHVLNRKLSSKGDDRKTAVLTGAFIGLFNFASFFAVMSALKTGPASVIFPIIGLNMLITVFLTVIIYHEKVTYQRLAALILSIAAIILLRQ